MALAARITLLGLLRGNMGEKEFGRFRDMNYNENLANIVLNRLNTNKIYDAGKKYIQKADPVFMQPRFKKRTGSFLCSV